MGMYSANSKHFSHFFYLKTEAESASETLFLKEKKWMMDKVQKQDSSKITDFLV
jgi:hypothetical protein